MVDEAPCVDILDSSCDSMDQYDATVFLAEGGQRKYRWNAPDHEPSRTRLIPTGGHAKNGVKLIHPDGSVDYYQDTYRLNNPRSGGELYLKMIALRTRHVDRFGRTTRFYYEWPNGYRRVKYVVDYDGRTNTLSYASNDLLSQVTDPYGRSALFHYDAQNRLTNLVDVAGMTSSIAYDAKGYVTNLVTPYGLTSFEITETEPVVIGTNTNDFAGHDLVHRSVKITEPDGSQQLYIFRFDSESFLPTAYSGAPTGTPLGTLDDGSSVSTNNYRAVSYRNSFFWNAKQFSGLSTQDLSALTPNDYLRGRMRHWLQNSNDTTVTGILSIEQGPSLDGIVPGQRTFFDYRGKTSPSREGSESLVAVTSRVLPNGQTHYTWDRYNKGGFITNSVSTYSPNDASVATRTNVFFYAANVATNIRVGASVFTNAAYYETNYNLLTVATNADGARLLAAGGYEPVTSSNRYILIYASGVSSTSVVYRTTRHALPTAITNAVGDVTRLTRGSNGVVTSVLWPSGLLTTNRYDATGFLLKTVDTQIQRTNSFGYSSGNVATHTNELGLAVTHTWDNLQRLTSTSYPDGTFTSNRYDRLDLSARRDRMGKWSYFQHDAVQHLVAFTNANTNVTRFEYCGCGTLEAITNALQQPTTLTYDNQLRRTGVSLADGTSLTYKYDSIGRLTNVVDAASRSDTFYYNHQGRLTALSNSLGRALAIVYDKEDRPIQVTDENGITVTNVFDNLNRILSRSYPDGGVETFTYSTNGLIRHTNQLGQFTHFAYDAAGRTIAVTNAEQQVTQFKYDPSGNITNLIDGKNQVTKWVYDQYGLLRDKIDHLGNYSLSASYDANGRLINRWTPEKGEAGFYYDPVGNLTNIDYAASMDVGLTYDAIERLKTMSDAAGTTAFDYTATGQLRSEDGPWENDTISYGYGQGLRNTLSLQQPNASPWSQTYGYATGARRLDNVTSPAGAFDYYYLPQKPWLPATIGFPGGAYVNNSYDVVGQLNGTWLQNSADATLNAHTYGYDKWGQRTAVTNLSGDYRQYGYDKIGQLKTAFGFEQGGAARLQEKHGYAYDAAGNLAYRTNNAFLQTIGNNTLNQLTSIARSGTLTVAGVTAGSATNVTVNSGTASLYSDGTFAKDGFVPVDAVNIFTAKAYDAAGRGATNDSMMILPENANYVYDLNGNLRTNSNQYITFLTYDYDDENQLIRITEPSEWKTEFTYDALRRCRVRKEFDWKDGVWALTKEVRYIYDRNLVIQERDGFNLPHVTYTRGLDLSGSLQGAGGIGGLLARTEGALNPQQSSSFYHADANGNVTTLIDAQQNVVARYQYDPYGTLISSTGSKADANVYRFSSKEIHVASGLYSFGYRFYDPKLQRWINRDPIGEEGGINLYGFVHNDPLQEVDPFGLTNLPGDFGWGQYSVPTSVFPWNSLPNLEFGEPYPPLVPAPPTPPQPEVTYSSLRAPDRNPFTYNGLLLGAPHLVGTPEGRGLAEMNADLILAPLPCPKVGPLKALHRPYLRKETKKAIEAVAERARNGQFLDANTGEIIEGTFHYGHRFGYEHRRLVREAHARGMTQREFNDWVNSHPEWFQIESPVNNLSHRFEKPGP
jgi:RHS repeat-associated protein